MDITNSHGLINNTVFINNGYINILLLIINTFVSRANIIEIIKTLTYWYNKHFY